MPIEYMDTISMATICGGCSPVDLDATLFIGLISTADDEPRTATPPVSPTPGPSPLTRPPRRRRPRAAETLHRNLGMPGRYAPTTGHLYRQDYPYWAVWPRRGGRSRPRAVTVKR